VLSDDNSRVFRNRLGAYGVEMYWDARKFWHCLNLQALYSVGEEPERLEWNPAKGSPPAKQIAWLRAREEPSGVEVSSSMRISIVSVYMTDAMTFVVEPTDSVRELQLRVMEAVQVPPHLRQQLKRNGVMLTLSSCLAEAGVNDGDELELAILPARIAVTAAWDGSAKIWNAESGQCMQTLIGHGSYEVCSDDGDDDDDDDTKCVNAARFSSNGKTVLTASADGTAKIWNAETGECVQTFVGHKQQESSDGTIGGVNSAVFSADCKAVLTAGADGTAKIWDALTGECTHNFVSNGSPCNSATFSSDNESIITTFEDHTAKVWSTETGECKQTVSASQGSLVSAVFSVDGTTVLIASTDGTAKIWSFEAGEYTHVFNHGKPLSFAVFSPDGTLVLTASCEGLAQIWSIATGTCTQTLCPEPDAMGFRPEMVSAVFSTDGAVVLTASADEDLPAAHIWDTDTGKCIQTLIGHARAVRSVAFAP